MKNGDEFFFDGGIQFQDDPDGAMTEFQIQISGPSIDGMPQTMELLFVNGGLVLTVAGITPETMRRLGKWIVDCANETIRSKE